MASIIRSRVFARRRRGPALRPDQGHERDRLQGFLEHRAIGAPSDPKELLDVRLISHRHDQPASGSKLVEERRWDLLTSALSATAGKSGIESTMSLWQP